MRLCAPGPHARAVQLVRDRLVEDLVDQRRLAGARHARDGAEHAERHLDVHALEVVLLRALDLHVGAWLAALLRWVDRARAGQELAGQRLLDPHDLLGRALGDDVAAVLAGARPHVDQVVGRAHRALVVLHDEHRVAEVAQPLQRRDQPRVVALVQADRRLVEDVEHADERRADLGREPDPLRLAAAQRRGGALHRQVADADVVQEAQPLVYLAQDQPRDRPVLVGELQPVHPLDRPLGAERRELVDRDPADLHRARLRPQARALALRARPQRHVLLDLLPRPVGVGLLVAALEVRDDALERRHVGPLAAHPVAVGDVELVAVRAVQEEVAALLRQVLPRRVHVHLVALRDRLRDLLVVRRRAGRPRQDRPLVDRQRRVRHHEVRVDLHHRAEARAFRAGPVRRVERERAWLELRHRDPAVQAGEALGVGVDLGCDRPAARSRPR